MEPTIGINLTWLVPGVVGGSEEYAVRLLTGAAPLLDRSWSARIYGPPALAEAHPALTERYEFVAMPSGRLIVGKAARIGLEQTWLARASRSDALVHHVGGTIPFIRPGPAVVTVHDLQPIDLPENFGVLKRRWLGALIPYAVRNADYLLTPSRFTAARLIDRYGVDPDRVRVVPHGHGPTAQDRGPGAESPPDRRSGQGIDPARFGRYLLYPAIAYRHKRHRDLVVALDRLTARYPDLAVVFTGRDGPETAALRLLVERLGLTDRVHFTGRVPSPVLDRLYRSAAAVVFPSSYEGFGNPALEAMLHGCPLITSDAGALPEVVGDAGLIVPVGEAQSLETAIAKLLDDPGLAEDLRHRGRERARRFDTGIGASVLVDVYREMLSRGR